MKIEVYFRNEKIGTGVSNGDEVQWDTNRAAALGAFYMRQGYKGDKLLKVMLDRVQGNTWTQEVK